MIFFTPTLRDVSDLLLKIQENAKDRLELPVGRSPAREIKRYKTFLKVETARLKILHRGGGGGREVCRVRSEVLDQLQIHILDSVRQNVLANSSDPLPRFALVAIGGYGRAELNPCSDIDIMLLHASDSVAASMGKLPPFLQALVDPDGLLYTLYDMNLKVGHSVRTINDCVKVANEDMQSKTSLLEARLITGDEQLFEQMQSVVLAKCILGFEDEYIAQRIEDQDTRRKKWGDTAFLQEPNIKNGCGGLRDYQNLIWMSLVKYRTRNLKELQEKELISRRERKDLEAAYDFLLRSRNELHYLTNREGDILTKNVQPKVAYALGYTDRSPARRLELFMHDYYLQARNIHLITRTIERRLALLPNPGKLNFLKGIFGKIVTKPYIDGFDIHAGELKHQNRRVFSNAPRRLMRVFLYAQQRNCVLHPDTSQLVRQSLRLVDGAFIADEHVHSTFQEILSQKGTVAGTLRAMHEVDFLGKYMPEFGRMTALVQHEFYHQYTGDEHTLRCIEKLDELWEEGNRFATPYHRIFQQIDTPFPLYLAMLLHDAGRGLDATNHSESGSKLAQRVATRLQLDEDTTDLLRFLIEHHLTMVSISQRRDLDDATVISHFANIVQSPENLNLLTLHTVADSMGTSDDLWNGFKDQLLRTLYMKTNAEVSGDTAFMRSEQKHREQLRGKVIQILPSTFKADEINAHFDKLPRRYFHVHGAREIASDLQLVHRFMWNQLAPEEDKLALAPVITWRDETDLGCTSMRIATWDRRGLFSLLAGAFAVSGLSILSARGFTRDDEIVLDTFHVVSTTTGEMAGKKQRERFEETLFQAVTEQLDFHDLLASRNLERPTEYHEGIETEIDFDNDTSANFTVMDLETEDRVGLLFAVSDVLADLGIDIELVKIATEKGAAIDSFYLCELGGGKLKAVERQSEITAKIRTAILGLDGQ
ncbi:MAG: [protein-PII] uridylyltransferase [Yoonia sp.]